MPIMLPPKLKGIAWCQLKGIPLSKKDIRERGCVDPNKQFYVVCKYFDYHGGVRARKCYAQSCPAQCIMRGEEAVEV